MRRVSYACLDEHPHRAEVRAALARIPALGDDELRALAARWINTPVVARARARALHPDTVLVVDTLRVFDDVAQLFADELDGIGEHNRVEPTVVSTALKAIRDALAGMIARPVLSRRESAALEAPWHDALGPVGARSHATTAAVERLLAGVSQLSHRCHDSSQAAAFDQILVGALSRDRDDHSQALDTAFRAAVGAQRHRTWSLVRVSAERGLSGRCRSCPPSPAFDDYDRERVIGLCADAACALLVADVVATTTLDVLLGPLAGLVPIPRPPLGA